jgi:molecular chaperone Hsp33
VSDELVRAVSASGGVRVEALVGTELVAEAARRHGTTATATTALGRALLGGVLLAASAKEGETLQLQFRGNGPLGPLTVIADSSGRVRGFVARPDTALPARDGRIDVAGAVGRGNLAVVRHHPAWRQPYTGIVELETGEIALELARYLALSEQRNSVVALGLRLGPDARVDAAGGYVVEALPGVDEAELSAVEENQRALPNPSEWIQGGATAGDLADRLLAGVGSGPRERRTPRFACSCSRERALRAAGLLRPDETAELVSRGEPLEVRCEFCAERYELTPAELARALRH